MDRMPLLIHQHLRESAADTGVSCAGPIRRHPPLSVSNAVVVLVGCVRVNGRHCKTNPFRQKVPERRGLRQRDQQGDCRFGRLPSPSSGQAFVRRVATSARENGTVHNCGDSPGLACGQPIRPCLA